MLDGRSDFIWDELDITQEIDSNIDFSFDIELRLKQTRQIAEASKEETESEELTENQIYILAESTRGLWTTKDLGHISCGNRSCVHSIRSQSHFNENAIYCTRSF